MANGITGVQVQQVQQVTVQPKTPQPQDTKPTAAREPVKDTVDFSAVSQQLAVQKSQGGGNSTDELGESLAQQATEARAGKR
jgi:hypothetical protein